MANDFLFAEEQDDNDDVESYGSWKVLIVDDEPEVHAVTKLALSDFTFQGKDLQFISAYSGEEAKQLILEHPDAAIVLLDVVMETDDAGLKVAQYIREVAHNNHVRIILRTGQPGQAPERQVIVNYDINDYKSKTELTAQKLFTVVMASLRSYRDILSIDQSRLGLEKIIRASADIFSTQSMDKFIDGIMQQLTSIIGCVDEAMYVTSLVASSDKSPDDSDMIVLSGRGEFESYEGKSVKDALSPKLRDAYKEALDGKKIVYREDYLFAYCTSNVSSGALLYVSGLPKHLSETNKSLIELFSQNVQVAYENMQLKKEVEETQREIVYRLSEAVELRSEETGNHVKRMANICQLLAQKYGLSESESRELMQAAPLHDVGKVGIPDSVLNKPGRLEADEMLIMQLHAEKGYQILKDSERSIVQTGAIIARDHHEKWDGTGYPAGKAGMDIHTYGRISALADVYDALRHQRCYKEAWDRDKVLEFIKSESGKHFEPKLVDIFVENINEFESILSNFPD